MRVTSLCLQSGDTIEVSDLVAIVGPNSVGKSTLLREIFGQATGLGGAIRWLRSAALIDRDYRRSAQLLLSSVEEGSIGGMAPRFSSRSSRDARGWPTDTERLNAGSIRNLRRVVEGASGYESIFTQEASEELRHPFFALLPSAERLSTIDRVATGPLGKPPGDAINLLWRSKTLFERLRARVRADFGVTLVLLDHAMVELELGIAEECVPSELLAECDPQRLYEGVEEWKRRQYTPLSFAGDGLRAAVALLLAIVEPVHQVLLIDEPELHLYPTKRTALGREISRLAKEAQKQVFCTTHDPTFLQGLLEDARTTTVLRLGQEGGSRRVRRSQLDLSLHGAAINRRDYLNAVFQRGAIIVEGITDRVFYEAAIAECGISSDQIEVIASDGKGNARNIALICQDVGVPWSIVVDFDAVFPTQLAYLGKLVNARGGRFNQATILAALQDAANEAGGLDALKAQGLNASGLQPETVNRVRAELERLWGHGIFVVETGEVESWVPEVTGKSRFIENAIGRLREDESLRNRLRPFLTRVVGGIK